MSANFDVHKGNKFPVLTKMSICLVARKKAVFNFDDCDSLYVLPMVLINTTVGIVRHNIGRNRVERDPTSFQKESPIDKRSMYDIPISMSTARWSATTS